MRAARSLRTQQRAYDPTTTLQAPVHATPEGAAVLGAHEPRAGRTGQRSTLEHHPTHSAGTRERAPITVWARLWTGQHRLTSTAAGQVLLRKEVIQPHLPVRL